MHTLRPSFLARSLVGISIALSLAAAAFAQPTITGFSPATLGIGQTVVITGTNFIAGATVRFSGVTATGATITPTQITVATPSTLNPGTITVTTSAGVATSATSYAVSYVPVITGFTPPSGPVDRIVTINGYNFSGTGVPSRTVRFNGVLATFPSSSNSAISIPVPAGATTGPITVETVHGIATSATNFSVGPGAPPLHDNFATAQVIGGPSGSVTGNNANATSEPGEPIHPGSAGGKSVWFKWTAPSTGRFLFNPYDGSQFGIVQAIYTGSSVGALTLVANGLTPANIFARFSSAAVLNAVAGTTYAIALDGYEGTMANYRLAWAPFGTPTISSFTPTSGFSGQQISITGTNFSPGSIVTIGGAVVNPARINWNSQTSIIVNQLPYASTTGPIVVTTPSGTATSAGTFVVQTPPVPVITGLSTVIGVPGTSVTITGTTLWLGTDAPQPIVRFNGVAATTVLASTSTSLLTSVPAGASTGLITVELPQGTATSPTIFEVPQPPPVISSFTPGEGPVGTSVTITGLYFTPVNQVLFNGVPATFTIDTPLQITAIVPAGATTGEIALNTPTAATFSGTSFVVTAGVPTIAGFAPLAIASGSPVIITGTRFIGVTSVKFNGASAAFIVDSTTQITATAPAGLSAGAITVTTPEGTATSPTNYTVSLPPTITSIVPSFGPVGRVIVVNGTNFTGTGVSGQVLLVNGTPIGSFSRGATTYAFAIPAGATTGPITLQTSQGFATSPGVLTVAAGPAPANDNFANAQPISGSSGTFSGNTANATKEPGEPIHSGNAGGASVWFSWTAPSSGLFLFNPYNSSISQFGIIQSIYTGSSVGSLTLVASGLTPTSVFARFGSAAVLNAIAGTTYRIALDGYNGVMADYRLTWNPLGAPTISSFTPGTAMAGQVVNVNITGTNLTPGSIVTMGGVPVDPSRLAYNNTANLFTITQVPINAVTGPIVVTTPAGTATSTASFVVIPPPAPSISSFSPGSGVPGALVTINGSNFTGAAMVLFNGVPAPSFVVGTATIITTSVPAGATTGPITVIAPGGFGSSSTPFAVIPPAPASIVLSGLTAAYDGTPKSVTYATVPPGLPVTVTYDGSLTAPTLPGRFAVVATVTDPSYVGTASGTLAIDTTALVRRISLFGSGVDGSVQLVSPENTVLNAPSWISGDLLVVGTPSVVQVGSPLYGGTIDATGSAFPNAHVVTLNNASVLRHVVRRVDARVMPVVPLPAPTAGTRNVVLSTPGQSAGDFSTIRNLSLSGTAGMVSVPPGTYGDFTTNGNGGFVLGYAGADVPAVYNVQKLTCNGSGSLRIVGPVRLTVNGEVSLNCNAGESAHPEWLSLNVVSGGVSVKGNFTLTGHVIAPNGMVMITLGKVRGTVVCNELRILNNGLLEEIND